ncbi:uncharacterized protein METZ01_LOCUS77000 [marine metagenome]|uniref:Type IX secretion system protein PorV domain-containing protein n=1 Tax=marine metagenome TaxID=408172 RepID=A0A381U7E0_9ZZZZ
MRKLNKYIILFFLITSVYAVDKTGTTAAKFLSIGVGSKASGMGGAFTSIANDATAMYWNPAGLSFNNTKEVYFNHANWIADISFDYFGFTIPMNGKSTIGFNITSVTMDEMEVTRYGNEDTGETFKAADYAIGSTYALNLTDRFSIGLNSKYIQQSIANSHAKGLALDFGTLFVTPFGFRLGTSISNFGPKLMMTGDDLLIGADVDENIEGNNESVTGILSTDYFDLPLVLRIGISDEFQIGSRNNIVLSLDAISPNDNANYINVGAGIYLLDGLISLYGGINSIFLENAESEFSFGGGLRIPQLLNNSLSINFTHEQMKFLGNTQQVSISFNY